ncbi:MAG: CDP-2,3-bis-(O-geranylgeranyl)-sn-glycerol synthase [Candidatus Altiarchaeota archaeon]|nr:CDP-2,3-bis-(O-geranylgeranyl)-sn-glycerol synthase [Candidatus Altiarchaeota archaeon]
MNWIIEALLWISPAYTANMAPVFSHRFNFLGLRRPIDGGRMAKDGNRLLGDGKTWQGIVAATVLGALTGQVLSIWGLGTLITGAVIGFFAIFGDTVGSFMKRRIGVKRGGKAGLLDSMDFIIFSLLVSLPLYPWKLEQIALLLIINPVLHRSANIIGYWLKLKNVPW